MKTDRALPIALIGLALALAACGATASPSASTTSGTTITGTLTEYKIALSATSAPAGSVTFNVTNSGTMVHEFVILKTDTLAKDLPLADGVVVEADHNPVGEVAETDAGKSGTFTATFTPGHYAIICNIAGHVAQGMVTDFTVN
jgi:uncharacterized cupredoxin-like copper-binding protein